MSCLLRCGSVAVCYEYSMSKAAIETAAFCEGLRRFGSYACCKTAYLGPGSVWGSTWWRAAVITTVTAVSHSSWQCVQRSSPCNTVHTVHHCSLSAQPPLLPLQRRLGQPSNINGCKLYRKTIILSSLRLCNCLFTSQEITIKGSIV